MPVTHLSQIHERTEVLFGNISRIIVNFTTKEEIQRYVERNQFQRTCADALGAAF